MTKQVEMSNKEKELAIIEMKEIDKKNNNNNDLNDNLPRCKILFIFH